MENQTPSPQTNSKISLSIDVIRDSSITRADQRRLYILWKVSTANLQIDEKIPRPMNTYTNVIFPSSKMNR